MKRLATLPPALALLTVACQTSSGDAPIDAMATESESGTDGSLVTATEGTSPDNDESSSTSGAPETGSDGLNPSDASSESSGAPDELCGNAVIDDGEACDDGINDGSYGGCESDCLDLAGYCGDGATDLPEETCDLAAENGTASCNTFCQVPGTLLASIYEEIVVPSSAYAEGIRVTEWNDKLAVVFGGPSTSIWELDPNEIEAVALRNTELAAWPVAGAHGLDNGNLLVAGGFSKDAFIVDEDLQVQWTYENPINAQYDGFAGVAAGAAGAMLGARHYSYGASEQSAYWVQRFDDAGDLIWSEIDIDHGTHDIIARDFRNVGAGRAVLLTDVPGGHSAFRLYDEDGGFTSHHDLAALSGTYRNLCAGDGGFFVRDDTELVGFDAAGVPTFDTSVPVILPDAMHGIGCSVRESGSPLVALNAYDGTALHVVGFDQAEPVWLSSLLDDQPKLSANFVDAAIHLDESQGRAWIFVGGAVDSNLRFVYAALIAI